METQKTLQDYFCGNHRKLVRALYRDGFKVRVIDTEFAEMVPDQGCFDSAHQALYEIEAYEGGAPFIAYKDRVACMKVAVMIEGGGSRAERVKSSLYETVCDFGVSDDAEGRQALRITEKALGITSTHKNHL